MNTILFVTSGVILVLVVLAKIPGLEHTVRPMIGLLFTALEALIQNSFSWGIWLFKNLLSSHIELVQHLMFSAQDMDPSLAVKEDPDLG